MRLTLPLSHAKYFWWGKPSIPGKSWGRKPVKDTNHFQFKFLWRCHSKRKLVVCNQTLPEGVVVEDPNKYVKESLLEDYVTQKEFVLPWPYSERPIRGSPEDPNYRSRPALVFTRRRSLLDPINQSLVFTNTICENDSELPESVARLSVAPIDDQFLDLAQRRLRWCDTGDAIMRKLPLDRVFPALDQRPPRVWGIPKNRKESNYLKTLYDLSEMYISEHYGYVDSFKVSHPYCVVPLERDQKLVILDLECDFLTVSKASHSLPVFSRTPIVTIDKPLPSIFPLQWAVTFQEQNFYPIDYSFNIGSNYNIRTIFLSQNELRRISSEQFIARAIMFCYGYAVAYARKLYGDDVNGKELVDPISIQCVCINPTDFSIGFVCFQLNTTSFDSPLKNQVWFESSLTDLRQIMQKLIALQLCGCVDTTTNRIKTINVE